MKPYNDIHFRSRDGLRLYARDYAPQTGAAKCPVICLHGLTRNSGDFEELAPWIAAQGRRVLALDVRGRGRSEHDRDSAHYHPGVYAADVQKLADDLGIARAVFIGTSMGGIITMTLALRQPRLIAAAILNDVGPWIAEAGLQRIAAYAGKGAQPRSWDEARAYIADINRGAFPGNDAQEWDKWARRAFAQNEAGELVLQYDPQIAQMLHNGRLRPRSWLATLAFRRLARRRPAMLIRGALSDLITPEQAAYMHRLAPRLRYAEVPGVGHAPMLMEAEARQAIEPFLAEVD